MERVERAKLILGSVVEFLNYAMTIWKEEDGAGTSGHPALSERMKILAGQILELGADFEQLGKENRELKEQLEQLRSQLDPEVGLGKRKEENNVEEGVKRPCVQEVAAIPKPKFRTYPFIKCQICNRKFIFEPAFQAHLKTHQDRDAQLSASSTPKDGRGQDLGGDKTSDMMLMDISSVDDDQEMDKECQNEPEPPLENSPSQVDKQEQDYQAVDSIACSGTGLGKGQGQGDETEICDDNSATPVDINGNIISLEGGVVEMETIQQPDENSFRVESEIQDQTQQQVLPPGPSGTLDGFNWMDSTGLDLLAEISGLMSPAELAPTVETPGLASSSPVDVSSLMESQTSFNPGTENGHHDMDGESGPVPLDEPGCPPNSSLGENKGIPGPECGKSFSSKAALEFDDDSDSDLNTQEEYVQDQNQQQVPPPIETPGGCLRLRRYILANHSTSPSGNPPVESPSDPISCSCFCCSNLMEPTGLGLIVLAEVAGVRSSADLTGPNVDSSGAVDTLLRFLRE